MTFWLELAGILVFPLLLAANAFFVASEFSLVAVRRTRMEELRDKGVLGAALVLDALDNLNRYIAATQLGITLASLGLGFIVEEVVAQLLSNLFSFLPAPLDILARHSVAATIAFVLVTFLHVVLGELLPKTVAMQMPDRLALYIAPPLVLFELCTRPFNFVISSCGQALVRWLGFRMSDESLVHSVEELTLLIEDTEEAGIIDADQANLLRNVFLLSQKQVKDCMIAREKMDALELSTPIDQVIARVRASGHTRLPVFEKEFDNIVGIVNSKDLLFLLGVANVVVLEDALYPAIYLKPDEEVSNALRLFKKSKKQMALVRDESDRILGMVTLEDILEEIIGDIEDEQDLPLPHRGLRKLRRFRRRGAL